MSSARNQVVLGDAEIADIVNGRQTKGAVEHYSKKYGISTTRVRNIWKKYYGGTTLADAATGLKVPLPGAPGAARPSEASGAGGQATQAASRKAGKFVVEVAPSFVPASAAATRAKPVREFKPPVRESAALGGAFDLAVAEGEINAGNNSGDLAAAIQQVLARQQQATTGGAPARREAREISSSTYSSGDGGSVSTEVSGVEAEEQRPVYRAAKTTRGELVEQSWEPSVECDERSVGYGEESSYEGGAGYPPEPSFDSGGVHYRPFLLGESYGEGAEAFGGGGGRSPGFGFTDGARGAPCGGRGEEGRGGPETSGRGEGKARPQRTSYWPIPSAGEEYNRGAAGEVPRHFQPAPRVRLEAGAASLGGVHIPGGPYGPLCGGEGHRGPRVPVSANRGAYQPPRGAEVGVLDRRAGAQAPPELSYIERLRQARRPA